MTRGTDINLAYVFTAPARPGDPNPAPGLPLNWTATTAAIANNRIPGRPAAPVRGAGPARSGRRARRRPGPRRCRIVGHPD